MRLVGYRLSEANELVEAGKYPEAVDAYKALITQYPEDGRAYSGLAWAYWRQDMAEEALQSIQDGWDLNSNYYPFFVTAARIYERSGLTAQALVAYKQVLAINPRFQEAIDGIELLSRAHE
jgi:tetratricopeptide (TPR) repeat protein